MAGCTLTYGLLGHPLGHSFSRSFFTDKFEREGLDAEYLNFDLPDISELPRILQEHPHLRGLNVTIPYKEQVMPFLDDLSEEARAIGAVNVIKVTRGADASSTSHCGVEGITLKGFNSDILGFKRSIQPLLQPHHRKALILGTGGASKAIRVGLEQLGLEWCYVSRKAQEGILSYADLTPERMKEYTVIVNCTPLGMFPRTDACPEIPYRSLTPRHLLYDLVYNPDITLFMQQGRRQGATVKNGLEMLHLQALASWEMWNA